MKENIYSKQVWIARLSNDMVDLATSANNNIIIHYIANIIELLIEEKTDPSFKRLVELFLLLGDPIDYDFITFLLQENVDSFTAKELILFLRENYLTPIVPDYVAYYRFNRYTMISRLASLYITDASYNRGIIENISEKNHFKTWGFVKAIE